MEEKIVIVLNEMSEYLSITQMFRKVGSRRSFMRIY